MDLDELARKHGLELVGEVHPFWAAFPWELRSFVNEVLEEAARRCEAMRATVWEGPDGNMYSAEASADECAEAIRSLKLK